MSLEIPELDDRTYADIRDDLLKRLPVYAPEWTDHNAHDPGITLLELFAWLVETYGYQLDRIDDAHLQKYLDLVGVTPRPPQPATVELAVTPPDEGRDRIVPARTPIAVETPEGEDVRFETTSDVVLTTADLAAVVAEHGTGRTDHTRANDSAGRSFLAFGEDATVGNAMYLGFRGDPFDGPNRLDLRVAFDPDVLSTEATVAEDPERFTPSLVVDWERCTNPDQWYRDESWEAVETLVDETTAFYSDGLIRLAAPDDWAGEDETATILDWEEPLVWLRAVVRDHEEPGRTDYCGCEHDAASSDPTDLTIQRYELPPRLAAISLNVVTGRHGRRVAAEQLERDDQGVDTAAVQSVGQTTGRHSQRFDFPDAPVLEATVTVGGTAWTEVDDFAASGPDARHYTLDRDAGVVTFGDGRRGTIPKPDQPVVARGVVYGGGPAGNVPAESTWVVPPSEGPWDVQPLDRPAGGTSGESIEAAFQRARDRRNVPHRTVTRADYRDIALRTPRVQVARAAAIVDEDAAAPNAVDVVVVPDGPENRRPIPTGGFLDAVEYQLCVHSLLTDRVAAVPPTYVSVNVSAEVLAEDGVPRETVRNEAVDRLETYIDPLAGYDGDGWPFDRPVYRSDVFDVLERLPAVADAVEVRIDTGDEADLAADRTALPYLADVSVTVREDREKCGRGI